VNSNRGSDLAGLLKAAYIPQLPASNQSQAPNPKS